MPAPTFYNNDDEDKKKGSSSGSSTPKPSGGSKKSELPTQQYKPTKSQNKTQSLIQQGRQNQHERQALLNQQQGGFRGAPTTGWNREASTTPTQRRRTQQTQTNTYQPQNSQQRLSQSNATTYGLQGVNGIGQQRPDIKSDGKWYAGENPTDIETMARIVALNGGDDLKNQLMDERWDKGSQFYRAYNGVTSEAVGQLANLGVEVPAGGLTEEWFERNAFLMGYYNPAVDSTTGAPKKPKKNAPLEEKLGYWYYQAMQDRDDTNKAENEYAALKEEIAHLVGSNKNYSDDEIARMIGWDKYPTLQKMDSIKGSADGTPMQFVRRIDWDQDYLGGMIWSARNNYTTGDSFSDSVNALLGYGVGYEDNPEIRAKRTWTRDNKDYSPYSFGPSSKAMEDAGLYFHTHTFDKKWLDENAEYYMNSGDPKAVEMIKRVLAADQFTDDCEDELDTLINGEVQKNGTRSGGLDDQVNNFFASYYKPGDSLEDNVDRLLESVYNYGDYKNLEKLDDSLVNNTLRDTTRPINYRRQDIRQMLMDKLSAKIETPTVDDATQNTQNLWDETINNFFPKRTLPDEGELVQWKGPSDKAVKDTKQKTAAGTTETIMSVGTGSEQSTWRTSEIGQQDAANSMVPYVKKGVPTGAGGKVYYNFVDGAIDGQDYINNRNTINEFDDLTNKTKETQDRLDELRKNREERHNSSDYIVENFGEESTKGAALFGFFGKKKEPEPEPEETQPSVDQMTFDQKVDWLNKKMLRADTPQEQVGALMSLRDRYRESLDWDNEDEATPLQRQILDDELAALMAAPQAEEEDELVGLRNDAVRAVAKLNPELADASFDEAATWLAEQNGDSNDFLDARDAVEEANLMGDLRVYQAQQDELKGAYDGAYDAMRKLQTQYSTLGTMWKITGSGGDTEVPASHVLDYVCNFAEYQPYAYDDTNYYDSLIKDGKDPAAVYKQAKEDNATYAEVKKYIQSCIDVCEDKGVQIPPEYLKNMQRTMDRIDILISDGNYYAMRDNDDFDTFVADQKAKEYEKDPTQTPDLRAQFDFMSDEQWQLANLPGTDFSPANIYAMTEDERNTLWYVYGKQKEWGAQKYYDHLTNEYGAVTTRRGMAAEEDLYNAFREIDAHTANIGGTVATVAVHPLGALGGIYTAFMAATGREANPYSSFFATSKASSRERETMKQTISDNLTNQFGNGWWVDLATGGYDAVTSVADNIWDAVVMNGAGKALGIASPLVASEGASVARKVTYNVINGTVTAMPIGMSAGGMAYVDAIGRGMPPEKAYIIAGASALGESITEGLEIESFTDAYNFAQKSGFAGFVKNVVLSMANEAVGEGLSTLSDQAVDQYVGGAWSNYNAIRNEYIRQGLKGKELDIAVARSLTQDVTTSMIMGAASGGMSTTFTGTVGGIQNTLATNKAKKANARWNEILLNENSRMNEIIYNEFKQKNSDYFTNIENGYIDLGFEQEDAHAMAEEYAKSTFDDLKNKTLGDYAAELQAESEANAENAEVFRDQMFDVISEREEINTYNRNPRMEEVNNFEANPLAQYDSLVEQLTGANDTAFNGEVKNEAVSTLNAYMSYTAQAADAEANWDMAAAEDFRMRAESAGKALDTILGNNLIDKAKYPILMSVDEVMKLRQAMQDAETNQQGPSLPADVEGASVDISEVEGSAEQLQSQIEQEENRLAQMTEEFDGSEEARAQIEAQTDLVNNLQAELPNRRSAADILAEQAMGPEVQPVQGPIQAVRQAEAGQVDNEGTTSEAQREEQAQERQGFGRVTEETETPNPEGTTAEDQREDQRRERQGLGQVTNETEAPNPEGTTSTDQRNEQLQERQGFGRVTEETEAPNPEGTTAEDQRAEQARERQGFGRVDQGTPEINPVETMTTVNRGPAPLRPIQGPTRTNPFTSEFAEQLRSNDTMRGQVLQLSETPTSPQHATTMLATVFDSVIEFRDAIADGQAMAAARNLVSTFGMEDAVNAVKGILVEAANQKIPNSEAINALQVAAFVKDGKAARWLSSVIANGATPNRVKALVSAALQESATRVAEIQAGIKDGITTSIMYELAGDGELAALLPYQQAKNKAKDELRTAEWMVNTEQEEFDAARWAVKRAQEPMLANPTDAKSAAAWNESLKRLEGVSTVLSQYQQRLRNKQISYDNAMAALSDAYSREMTKLREKASAEADARINAARQAQAEREAAERLAQQRIEEARRAREQDLAWQEEQAAEQDERIAEGEQTENAVAQEQAAPMEETTGEVTQASEQTGEITQAEGTTQEEGETFTGTVGGADVVSQNGTQRTANESAAKSDLGSNRQAMRIEPNRQYPGLQPNGQNGQAPRRSPQRIAHDLSTALHIGDYLPTRRMNNAPPNVLGYYENRAQYMAVRPREAGDYYITMHEIGHGLQQRLGIDSTDDMIANLDPAFHQDYAADELNAEAFAEFNRIYMANEQAGRQFAGDVFVDMFERSLQDAGIADAYHDAANDLRAFLNADANEQIRVTMRNASERNRPGAFNTIRHIIASSIDRTSGAESFNHAQRQRTGDNNIAFANDVRSNALLENQAEKRAYNILTGNLTDSNWTRIGDSLATRFENAGLRGEEDFDLMSRYLLAKHSLARDTQGLPVFDAAITEEKRNAFIANVEQNHENVVRGAEAFQQFRKEFFQAFLVDTGYLTQEAFDRMNEMYPDWVPTYRVREGRTDGMRRMPSNDQYRVRAAVGSTEDIINPMDSFVSIVKSVVNMVSHNNTLLSFDNAMQTVEGLGEFAREVTPNAHRADDNARAIRNAVGQILNGQVGADVLQDVFDSIDSINRNDNMQDAVTVQLPDGTRRYYEVVDPELRALLNNASPAPVAKWMQKAGLATRIMSALTTGSNPLFAIRNALRDFQNSVDYGSWAYSDIDGIVKWAMAFYEVWTGSNQYQDYVAIGGGGWTRVDPAQRRSADDIRRALIPGYGTSTAGRTARTALNAVSSVVTLERINEAIEQTSRYAEYRFGRHRNDLDTVEGRQQAFLDAQDVTVDFARRGYGNGMQTLKQLIPFFSAATQGVYRTGRMLTEAERGRLPARFVKTVLNTALRSAIAAALVFKFVNDDDKFAFVHMSDDLKSKHFFLPNFAPQIFGDRPLLRIPLAQDPLTYAINGAITNAAWHGTANGNVIDILSIANTIVDDLNPFSSGTIVRPILDASRNRTYFGGKIIPTRLEGLDTNKSAQFTADTPEVFKFLGQKFDQSPLILQYLAEQYTGFVGQLLIPALSKDKYTGKIGGLQAAITTAQNRLTTDPLTSSEVVNAFYSNLNEITDVVDTVNRGLPLNNLRMNLTNVEAQKAYKDAKGLVGTDGVLTKTKNRVNELYAEIDNIMTNPRMDKASKNTAVDALRMQMIKECLRANEEAERYREMYITGWNLATLAAYEGAYAEPDTKKKKKKKK